MFIKDAVMRASIAGGNNAVVQTLSAPPVWIDSSRRASLWKCLSTKKKPVTAPELHS